MAAAVAEACFTHQAGGTGLILPGCAWWEGTVEPGREAQCTGDLAKGETLLEAARAVAPLSRIVVFYPQEAAWDSREQMSHTGWAETASAGLQILGAGKSQVVRCPDAV